MSKLKKKPDQSDQYRAYLNQFLADLYFARISNLTVQFNLLNKAVWLILIGLLLITSLVLNGYELVLLAGAVGGLLSRLQRMLISRKMYTDFSVYWFSLFFSPMVGALAAWAGLLLVAMLQKSTVLPNSQTLPLLCWGWQSYLESQNNSLIM
ncbi:Uncharacterised protein [uncultured archaeon]|nr:Uncharacterised protein [uncultured archaeon]